MEEKKIHSVDEEELLNDGTETGETELGTEEDIDEGIDEEIEEERENSEDAEEADLEEPDDSLDEEELHDQIMEEAVKEEKRAGKKNKRAIKKAEDKAKAIIKTDGKNPKLKETKITGWRLAVLGAVEAIIALIALYCIVVIFRGIALGSVARDYFNAYFDIEYDTEQDLVINILSEENNEILESNVFSEEDIRSYIIEELESSLTKDKFVSLATYTMAMRERDLQLFERTGEIIQESGKYDQLDVDKLYEASESVADDYVTQVYAQIAGMMYTADMEIIIDFMKSYSAIDALYEEATESIEGSMTVPESIFEMRDIIERVVADKSLKEELLGYSDKLAVILSKYAVIPLDSPKYKATLDYFGEEYGRDDYEYSVLEYGMMLNKFDNIDVKVNVLAINASEEAASKYEALQLRFEKYQKALAVIPFLDEEDMAGRVVSKAFIKVINSRGTNMVMTPSNPDIIYDNLSKMWQINTVAGGIFDGFNGEAGIDMYDQRYGLGYNVVWKPSKDMKLSDDEQANIYAIITANRALFGVAAQGAEEEMLDEETRTSYENLYKALNLVINGEYYYMDIY